MGKQTQVWFSNTLSTQVQTTTDSVWSMHGSVHYAKIEIQSPKPAVSILVQRNKTKEFLSTLTVLGFPDSSVGKESACNAGDPSSIPGSGRSAGERKGYPLQYSGLENSMDCIVYGVSKSGT